MPESTQPQQQPRPGQTGQMTPKPKDEMSDYAGSGLLQGKRALITGGDSGIGRAVAVAFAKEGADVAIAFLDEKEDAGHTKNLIDYSATKGAIIAFSQSIAQALLEKGIRVNVVAPGPVWTPLIPSTMPEDKVGSFGEQVPMGRPADPDEIAPSYVFFAANRTSSYYTGEVLAPVGGQTLPG
ncbi:MAG: hypothetical protein QOI42_1898 [Frankiaceae bacterium]|nr:hypothetical protein [Frankiaceae bacterium]